jgi:hypothetical protein
VNSAEHCIECGRERKLNWRGKYYTGHRNRCPTCYKYWLMSERVIDEDEEPHGRRVCYDDFLLLMDNEPRISIKNSAARLNVTTRTISRYRETWRESNAKKSG